MHLNHLTVPALVDLIVIKEEVKNDPRLSEFIAELEKEEEGVPDAVWDDISMDFIDGLPKAAGFDVILVVVDRLSKYAHFLKIKHPYTAKSVAEVFVKEVVRLHWYPRSIVSNQNKVFLSNFWHEMFCLSGTKLNRSSVYHPQSDGQIEMVNRNVEAYLRCFCGENLRSGLLG